jgi:hypothetical protein
VHGICLDLAHSKQSLLADDRFPVLNQVRPTKRSREQLASGTMFARLKHRKDSGLGEVCEPQIPIALHVLRSDLVYFLESIEICDTDLSGREAYNAAISLVERVDVEDSLARDNGTLKAEMCEACVPRSGKMSCGACETDVEELSISALWYESRSVREIITLKTTKVDSTNTTRRELLAVPISNCIDGAILKYDCTGQCIQPSLMRRILDMSTTSYSTSSYRYVLTELR